MTTSGTLYAFDTTGQPHTIFDANGDVLAVGTSVAINGTTTREAAERAERAKTEEAARAAAERQKAAEKVVADIEKTAANAAKATVTRAADTLREGGQVAAKARREMDEKAEKKAHQDAKAAKKKRDAEAESIAKSATSTVKLYTSAFEERNTEIRRATDDLDKLAAKLTSDEWKQIKKLCANDKPRVEFLAALARCAALIERMQGALEGR